MKLIFGPYTPEVLQLITDLRELSSEQLGAVTRAWKEGSDIDRAQAWAELRHATSKREWRQILAAASVARRQAMDVAQALNENDWAFWAAAWDAGAAIAGKDRTTSHYDALAAPLAEVLPALALAPGDVQIPAQRSARLAEQRAEQHKEQRAEEQAASEREGPAAR
jgi:hypothetical protein